MRDLMKEEILASLGYNPDGMFTVFKRPLISKYG